MGDLSLGLAKIKELLKEVTVDYSQNDTVDKAVASVREVLLGLPDQKVSASLATRFVDDLGVPNAKAAFTFVKPDSVTVVGSYASQTVTKPELAVDLAVRMPKSCFSDKDYLNHRYHAKRALYLAFIMQHLKACKLVTNVEWSSMNHDARKPVLLLHVGNSCHPTVIRLIPSISREVFQLSKLMPDRNNVKAAKSDEGLAQPTPHYTASILEDMSVEEHSQLLADKLSSVGVFREVVCLLKVWLRQRGYQGYQDSLNSHLITLLVVYLTTSGGGRRCGSQMNVMQLFRVVMDSIVHSDVLGKGVFLSFVEGSTLRPERKRLLEQLYDVKICDISVLYNVSYRMTSSALAEVKDAALHTLSALSCSRDCGFDAVFMTLVDFVSKFDYHIRIDPPEDCVLNPFTSYCLDKELWRQFEQRIDSVLSSGLQDRARVIRVLPRRIPKDWGIEKGLGILGKEPLFCGLLLKDLSTALRMATVGPSAENKEEAKRFRAFWGNKAELRRWADGTITEAAAWECESWQRHIIIEQIIHHILRCQFGFDDGNVHVVAGQLDFCLLENGRDQISVMPKLLDALKVLSDRIRNLDNLPLKVVAVHPLSSAFRHAATFPPEPHPLGYEVQQKLHRAVPVCVDALELLLQLEGSGSWPDDHNAVQKTKMAFCLKIAESLQKKWKVPFIAAERSVDILMHGFAFRLGIFYERDSTRLSKDRLTSLLSSNSSLKDGISLDAGRSVTKEDTILSQDVVLRSLHAKMLDGLQGVYPVYGPTVRLAKRWVSCHFLSVILCDEAVELLVAYLFVKPYPFSPPASRITGFLRFLNLLAKHDWGLAPLVVDVNGDLSHQDCDDITEYFDSVRTGKESNEGPAMYIATPYDLHSQTWTSTSPSTKDLRKVVAYARAAASLATRLICREDDSWPSLFRTPLNCFDALIHLHRDSLPHPGQILFQNDVLPRAIGTPGKPAENTLGFFPVSALKLEPDILRKQLLVGFDPVACFVTDLKLRVGSGVQLWCESFCGSDYIPLTLDQPTYSKILEMHSKKAAVNKRTRLKNGSGFARVPDLVSEIYEVGEGLVKNVQLIEEAKK